MEIYVLK